MEERKTRCFKYLMNQLLEQETVTHLSSDKQFPSHRYYLLYLVIWITISAALAAGVLLLLSDVSSMPSLHAPVSAAPLLLIGATYLGFQMLMRPKPLDLCKALIVSAAFLLWGIDQLLPTGWFATTLGDGVIVLYVIDLGWMMADRLKQQWKSRHARSRESGNERSVSSSQWDEKTPLLLLSSSTPQKKLATSQPIMVVSRGSRSFLKRNRLLPLPCTCVSPLAPLRSPKCCKEMQETSWSSEYIATRHR